MLKKKRIPWNKGKRGLQKHTDKTKKRLRRIAKERGYKPPHWTTLKGNIPWNKGKKCPQISEAMK